MENNLIARGNDNQAARSLDDEWNLMNKALAKVGMVERTAPLPAQRSGRLIVALDLTASREATLEHARIATAAMFDAIKAFGAIAVKLVYYRGSHECKASAWHDDASVVSRSMLGLSCKTGATQIARTLRLALAEKEKLSGVIFIGDHCEEDGWDLDDLAAKLGKKGIPIFVFHEVREQDSLALHAQPIFRGMAKASGGVYAQFKPDSGAVLREVLSSIAAFSTAGHEGLKQLAQPATAEARLLQKNLLLLPPPDGDSDEGHGQ
jgi:hypothetical protein